MSEDMDVMDDWSPGNRDQQTPLKGQSSTLQKHSTVEAQPSSKRSRVTVEVGGDAQQVLVEPEKNQQQKPQPFVVSFKKEPTVASENKAHTSSGAADAAAKNRKQKSSLIEVRSRDSVLFALAFLLCPITDLSYGFYSRRTLKVRLIVKRRLTHQWNQWRSNRKSKWVLWKYAFSWIELLKSTCRQEIFEKLQPWCAVSQDPRIDENLPKNLLLVEFRSLTVCVPSRNQAKQPLSNSHAKNFKRFRKVRLWHS